MKRKFIIKSIPKSECNYSILPYEKIMSFRDKSTKDYISIVNEIMNLLVNGYVIWLEEV